MRLRALHACVVAAILPLIAGGITAAGCTPTAPPSPAMRWEVIDPDPTGGDGPLEALVADRRFVAVGGASAWTSTDGRSWAGTPLSDARDGGASGLVGFDDGFVAVGTVSSHPAVWTSEDGQSWRHVPHDADLDPVAGFARLGMERVASGPHGLVAVGTEWGDAGQRPVAWRSTDGIDWTRSASPPTGSGPRDVATFEDGYVAAVADDARAGEMTRAAFWFSSDGSEWTASPSDPSFANAEPQALAVRNGLIVSVGYRVTPDGLAPMAWTSTDGRTWEAVPGSAALGWWPIPGPTPVQGGGALQGSMMSNISADTGGFVAVGAHWGLDPTQERPDGSFPMVWRAGVWRSPDGRSWDLLPDDPAFALGESDAFGHGIVSVIAVDGQLLAFGGTAELGATIWVGTATSE